MNSFDILRIDEQYEGILSFLNTCSKFQILPRAVYLPSWQTPPMARIQMDFSLICSALLTFVRPVFLAVDDFNSRISSLDDAVSGSALIGETKAIDRVINAHGKHFISYVNNADVCVVSI